MTKRSDLEGFHNSGVQARRDGESFFFNPLAHQAPSPYAGDHGWDDWLAGSLAWAAGWLAEDNGRDIDVQRLLNIDAW